MRRLKRLLIYWVISIPLIYFAILPGLMELLNQKARRQNFDQCLGIIHDQPVGSAYGLLSPEQIENHCHCVTDSLILVKSDIVELLKHQPPTALTAMAKTQGEICDKKLEETLSAPKAQPAMPLPAAAPPTTLTLPAPDETGVIHL